MIDIVRVCIDVLALHAKLVDLTNLPLVLDDSRVRPGIVHCQRCLKQRAQIRCAADLLKLLQLLQLRENRCGIDSFAIVVHLPDRGEQLLMYRLVEVFRLQSCKVGKGSWVVEQGSND